jgi:O-antigen/teichoic acid export membrane protein
MVNVVIALSASLVDMGLGVALIQRKNVTTAHYGSVFFFNITVGIVLSLLLFFGAPLVGYFYENEQLIPIARTMSFLFILSSVGNVLRVKLRKELKYGIPTKGNLIAGISSGILGVVMAFNGFGVWSLVAQSMLNPVVANAYMFYVYRWRPKLIFKWQALKDLWGFGFRMFLSGILNTLFVNADSLIIGKLFSPSSLGYYFRARSLNHYITQYSAGSIMSILLPTLSQVQDDFERFKNMVYKSYHLINFIAFFLTGLFFVVGGDLILFLFGDKWLASIPMFKLIVVTAYVYPISSLLVNILMAKGNSKGFLKLEVIKKIFQASALGFGFIWGIEGFLVANIISSALAVWVNIYFAGVELQTGQWWFLKITLPYLLLTILIAYTESVVLQSFNNAHLVNFIVGAVVFSLCFVSFAWLLKFKGLILLLEELKGFNLKDRLKRKNTNK